MNYSDPKLRQMLAAEYVLGTLRGAARRRFDHLARADRTLMQEQRRWEARLAELGRGVRPVTPPDIVWTRLDHAINASRVTALRPGAAATPARSGLLQAWAIAASLAAVALSFGLWREVNRPPTVIREQQVVRVEVPVPYVAMLQAAGSDARWLVALSPENGLIKVSMSGAYPLDSGRQSLELWFLDEQGKPHSLGLLPATAGQVQMPMPRGAAMPASPTLAVSREPRGGSPTGQPTGPVILTAPALRL